MIQVAQHISGDQRRRVCEDVPRRHRENIPGRRGDLEEGLGLERTKRLECLEWKVEDGGSTKEERWVGLNIQNLLGQRMELKLSLKNK